MKVARAVALVTGGASGIGWGIAERLAAEGASIVVADIDDRVGSTVAGRLPGAVFVHCDVSVDAQLLSHADRFGESKDGAASARVTAGPSVQAEAEVRPAPEDPAAGGSLSPSGRRVKHIRGDCPQQALIGLALHHLRARIRLKHQLSA
ncbi:MAG: SDR family oxidoreductase [Candidatus Dormibacteraeota bacterium]|uniref:SDR family oxidoreductase n=1 Tax=Candidatus Dormiibacter inghamiae TaxID=3127013 RepID=A0A934KIH3_9BACT|nr:SDR family oxidoreductase [Candidatus Dormibacteraeota bacterium]MBJ7606603.1 SDR family oxidoreductase [Candidatus Dormibacteraeota bacterium]